MLRVMSAIRTEKLLVLRPSRPPHNVYMCIHVKFYLDNYFLIEGKMCPYTTLCRLAEDKGMLSLRTDAEISYGYRHKH